MENHNHVHIHKHEVKGKNLVYSILLNLVITIAQIIGGIISGSLALISDALHNFSDVLSLGFSLYANKLSQRKASLNHTFGYKRAELIAAFINAITLIIVAFILIYEASTRLFHPEPIQSTLVIWLALLGIVINGGSVLLLKKDSEHNLNMKSAYLHLLTDNDHLIATITGDWKAWNFVIKDAQDKEIGKVSKKWAGLAQEIFTTADKYNVNLIEDITNKEHKMAIMASAITIDMVLKESK